MVVLAVTQLGFSAAAITEYYAKKGAICDGIENPQARIDFFLYVEYTGDTKFVFYHQRDS